MYFFVLHESWTLLSDDRGVRLTCESSLLSPFERRYTADIKVMVNRCLLSEVVCGRSFIVSCCL